jgi:hypothetical protein
VQQENELSRVYIAVVLNFDITTGEAELGEIIFEGL